MTAGGDDVFLPQVFFNRLWAQLASLSLGLLLPRGCLGARRVRPLWLPAYLGHSWWSWPVPTWGRGAHRRRRVTRAALTSVRWSTPSSIPTGECSSGLTRAWRPRRRGGLATPRRARRRGRSGGGGGGTRSTATAAGRKRRSEWQQRATKTKTEVKRRGTSLTVYHGAHVPDAQAGH